MTRAICTALALLFFSTGFAPAADAPLPLDGAGVTLNDPLLDHMTGRWSVSGILVGRPVTQTVEADWILNHQFLRIHEIGATDPKTGKPDYEAMPLVGYDNASERYVAHWIDVFGGRWSETLGYGKRNGDEIDFVFEYPDGPFHTDFIWNAKASTWRWHMTQKGSDGQWHDFADLTLAKQP
jgi:hypothetical protein